MSLNLTYGTVAVEDGSKAAEEYAPARKVRVELTFQVSEGSDGQVELDAASDAARRKVDELLGRTAISTGTVQTPDAPATRTRRTKAQIEADEATAKRAEEALKAADPAAMVTTPAEDPAGMGDVALPPASSAGASAVSADPAAFDMEIPAEVPAVEAITDADLNSAVQKRNQDLANAQATVKIRELIISYRTDPTKAFNLKDIPADKRPEFISKLAAITA